MGEGDAARAEYAIAQGVRAGMSEVALRRDVRGSEPVSLGWSDRRIGLDALDSIVFRARRGLRPFLALILESEADWTLRSVESTIKALPEHTSPALVALTEERQLGHLLAELLKLPGGAAVAAATEEVSRRLHEAEPYSIREDSAQRSVMNALDDALGVTTDEQAVMLAGFAKELHQSTATLLSRAIARFGGNGLTVLLIGEDEKDFQNPAVATLQMAFEGASHILQSDPESVDEDQSGMGVHPKKWTTHAGWATAGLTLAALIGVLADGSERSTAVPPTLSEDIIFCSARSGVHQYYRWGQSMGVERLSTDTAAFVVRNDEPVCAGGRLILSARADSFHLPVSTNGRTEWRTYPNVRSRGQVEGTRIELVETTARTIPVANTHLVVLAQRDGDWTLFDPRQGDTLSLPVPIGGQLVDLSRTSGLVRLRNAAGVQFLSVFDRDTGGVEFSTPGLIDDSDGHWLSDGRILISRGAVGADEDGSLELMVIHPEDGREEVLTRNDWNDYETRLSPDRTHVCWQSEEYGHYESDIRVMRIDDRVVLPQRHEPGRQSGCYFSSDGSFIVYLSVESGDSELVGRSVRGGGPFRITNFPGIEVIMGTVPMR